MQVTYSDKLKSDITHLLEPEPKDKAIQDELKSLGRLPRHIAMIMDGNGRWAKSKGLPRPAGHSEGIKSVRDIVEACGQLGIEVLTLYTFSSENWKRPKWEVSALMKLLLKTIRKEIADLNENEVRIFALGNLKDLPEKVADEMRSAIELTKENKGLKLNLALSYGSRLEILGAVKAIATSVKRGDLDVEDIEETLFSRYLDTRDFPDPDLLIRTGGEARISNFLLWQLAYTEIYITEILWPKFRREALYESLRDYLARERRFGRLSEQLVND